MNRTNDKWGFRPENSGIIDLDRGDFTLYRRLVDKIPGLQACIFCGGCHATCTMQAEGMNFRRIQLLLRRGMTQSLKQLAAPCVLCGKCTLVCPANVDTRSVIYNLKLLLHESI
jgi:heterodisulfide reductase subunit C